MADMMTGGAIGRRDAQSRLSSLSDPFDIFGNDTTPLEINQKVLDASKALEGTPQAAKAAPIEEEQPQAQQKPLSLTEKVQQAAQDPLEGMRDRFAVPVSERQWNIISRAAAESENPEEELSKYAAALTFSREYGISMDAAYANLDDLSKNLTGKPYSPNATGFQAISNSFKAGRLNMQFSELAYDFKKADLKGEDTSALLSQLDAMGNEIAGLKDHQSRNVLTTVLKWTAEGAVPYMMEVGKSALAGATFAGALGTGFTAATGVTLGSLAAASPYTLAAIIGMGAAVGAVNRTRELMEGASYLQLRQMGVDKDIANVGSRTYGLLVGAIETGLGIEAGTVIKAVGGSNLVTSASSKVMAKMITSGKLGTLVKGIAALGANATGEAVEEMIEEPLDYMTRHISYAIQDSREPGSMDPLPDENLVRNTLEAGLMGFASAIVLGGLPAILDGKKSLDKQAKIRRDAAAVPSKEAFIASMKQQKPDTVTTADWTGAMSEIWEKEHSAKKESTAIQSDENAIAELDIEKAKTQPQGEVRRLKDGNLYTQEASETSVSPDGTEQRRLLVGDPATSSRYGYIDYGIKDNTITIEDVLVKSGYESIRKEAVLSLARQYPGYDIQWEPKSDALSSVRDEILSSNPRGKKAGLQYWDGITDVDDRIMVERQIEKAMPNLSAPERALGATLMQLRAEAAGMNTQAYLDASYKDGKLFGYTEDLAVNMQGKRGAVAFDDDLKAIIYAGQKADFSTFAHETFHVSLRQMGQLDQFKSAVAEASQKPEFITWLDEHVELFADSVFEGKNAQDLADIAAGFTIEDWGRTQEEFAARLYEGYLADGKTASSKLKQLFNQIAKWMAQIYTTLRHSVDLDPRIIEVFDSLSDNQSPLAKQLVTQDANNGQMKSEALYQGEEGFMKAPNGKPTKLTERQWMQVRTPEFIKWFGDWMNDPENASKVVDENGEPLVVYHGTENEFNQFDFDYKGTGGWSRLSVGYANAKNEIYLTSSLSHAEAYGQYVMPLFTRIIDPLKNNAKRVLESWRKEELKQYPTVQKMIDEYYEGDVYNAIDADGYFQNLAIEAKLKGKDGVIVDFGDLKHKSIGTLGKVIIVFSPTQIKSATDNIGTFDGSNSNILFQEAPPTDSEAFKQWFGDSKVVDENGNPLVVYHGSRQWFDAFNDGTEKKHSKAPKGSIFATSSRKVAGSYYDYWGGTDPDVILEKDSPLHQNYSWGTYRKGGVYSLYMKIENPLIIDFEGKLWDEGDYDINEITKRAKSEGYDGVIAKNIRDIGFNDIPRDEYGNYQDTIATDYIAFNSTQVKATNNRGTWDAGNPNILYQEAVKKINNGTLAVLHNITAEKLTEVVKIGGLPSPSLAVTRPNIPFDQFGEITLIADPSVAVKAMNEERLYDRDVWSPTVPRAEWKINQKVIDKFDKKIMPVIYEETGKYFSGSDAFSRSDITRGPNLLIDAYKRTIEAQIAFLRDRGIDHELKFKKPSPPFSFPIGVIEANLEYFKSTRLETENADEVRKYLRPKVSEYLEKSLAHRKEKNPALYETMKNDLMDSYLRFGVLDKVFNFAKTYDKDTLVFDEYGTQEGIRQTIKDHDSDFTSWIKDNIKGAYTDPKIKIGSKKYDYNAENILEWMRSQSEQASQETMTYGPSKAAANAGRAFWNRNEVSESEDFLVTREDQQKQWVERIKPITEQLQNELPDYHKYGSWEAMDSIYEAIGRYIEKYGSVRNPTNMRKELSAKSFTKVPNYLIEKALDLVGEFAILPQDYFEAKPNRVVSLDEFVMAVVPSTIKSDQRAILEDHGIEVVEYVNEADRPSLVDQLYKDHVPNLLFQDDLSPTDFILEEARGFDSWQEWKAFYESFDDPYSPSPKTDDSWYEEMYNNAHSITSEQEAQQVEEAKAKLQTEQEKDQYMIDQLSTDSGVRAFVEKLGWMLSNRSLKESEGDMQAAEAILRMQQTAQGLVHPTIFSNAQRAAGGSRISDRAVKGIRTLMTGDALRYYRDIYADVMEDPTLKPQVIDDRLPGIDDPGYRELERLSISERLKLGNRIQADELRKPLLSGKETFKGATEIYIKDRELQIKELNGQISDLEKQITDMEKKLTSEQQTRIMVAVTYMDDRKKLDAELKKLQKLNNEGKAAPKGYADSALSTQAKLDKLHEEVIQMRKDARLDATIKKYEAVAKLKEQIAEKQAEKAEAKKIREYKAALARKIMVKPSDAINYEQAQAMYGIQALIDPNFRREGINVAMFGGKATLTAEEARGYLASAFAEGSTEDEIIDAIGKRNYERLVEQRKPLNDWTIEELEELANQVAELRYEGRRILEAKKERQNVIAQQYQDAIIRSLIATGKYTERPIVGTREDQEEKTSPKRTVLAARYATLPMRAKAMMLDGDTQGAAYNLLVLQKRAAQAKEWVATENRMKPVMQAMTDAGVTEKDLYKTVSVALEPGKSINMTYSSLMYAYLSQYEDSNKAAVAYGNLVTQDEKAQLSHDNKLIQSLGQSRYKALLDQAGFLLSEDDGKYMKVLDAVRKDFNGQKERINEIAIREFNQPMRAVEEYLPIHRREFSGEDMSQQVADDLFNQNAGGLPTGVQKGFTKDRIAISADHQRPIDLDLMQVWNRSVRQQEHFIAFAEYGRKLNRVFKNPGASDVKNVIIRTLGQEMLDDINDYIGDVVNPVREAKLKKMESAVRFMRGNLGAAYLTWKLSSMVLQTITSPAPFLIDVKPSYLAKSYMELASHPIETIERISEMSPMMKNRTMNVIIDQILQQSRTYTQSGVKRALFSMQELGSMGLTMVDRYAVAGGWLGAYHQRLDQLTAEGLDTAKAEQMAVVYADDITLKTQPTGDATEIAPLFTTGSEFVKAFTQFTTSMNVIWTNLTYDMPLAVRKGQMNKALGTLIGYGMAGAILGAVAEGFDDDDDEIDKLRKWIYWSFTQGTGSIPLIGDQVDEVIKSAVTGDKPVFFADEFFPGMSKLLKGVGNLTQGEFLKALENMGKGAGYMAGLPVSGIQQVIDATQEGPQVLLGR